MTDFMNRRRLLARSAAAIAASAMTGTALALPTGDADAAIFATVAELVAIRARLADAHRRSTEAHDRAEALAPPWPEIARQRPSDVATYGLPAPQDKHHPGVYTTFTLHELSHFRATQQYKVPLAEFLQTRPDTGTDRFVILRPGETEITLYREWPEAQARADDIIASLTAWQALRQRTLVETGYRDTEEEIDTLYELEDPLFERLIATRATTMAGWLAKAQMVALICDGDGSGIDLGETTDSRLGASIIADLLAIADNHVTVHKAHKTASDDSGHLPAVLS